VTLQFLGISETIFIRLHKACSRSIPLEQDDHLVVLLLNLGISSNCVVKLECNWGRV